MFVRICDRVIDNQSSSIRFILAPVTTPHLLIEAATVVHNGELHYCIPTQAGCPIGCFHCATTYSPHPFIRSLDIREVLGIIRLLRRVVAPCAMRVLSFSGHGEPLLNWATVVETVRRVRPRFDKVYVTTVGIRSTLQHILADPDRSKDFYLSIHGSCDAERFAIVRPHLDIASIEDLLEFSHLYIATGGRVVWNYVLTHNNTSADAALRLAALLRRLVGSIELRLCQLNAIDGASVSPPAATSSDCARFFSELRIAAPAAHIRMSRNVGASARIACGQMRAELLSESSS